VNPAVRARPVAWTPGARALADRLLPLLARLHAPVVEALASEVGAAATSGGAALGDALGDALIARLDARRRWGVRRDELRTAWRAARSDAERRSVLAGDIDRSVTGWRRWGDRRALRRHLDLDALLERYDRRIHEVDVALRVVAHLLTAEPATSPDAALALFELPSRVLRRAAMDALGAWLRRQDPDAVAVDRVARVVVAVASDPDADPLLARRALSAAMSLPEGPDLARRRLADRRGGDDFLVRAGAVRLLVARDPSEEDLIAAVADDPSETVRAALFDALVASGRAERVAALASRERAPSLRDRLVDGRLSVKDASPLTVKLAAMRSGERQDVALPPGLDALDLATALLPYARRGVGFALEPTKDGRVRVTRGSRRIIRAWRVWHELRHPGPAKRQGGDHLTGRTWAGTLRVPSRRMAEVSPTGVPGEPVRAPGWDGWAPWLPLLGDVCDALDRGRVRLVTDEGVTTLTAPTGPRLRAARATVRRDAARLDRTRAASLVAGDPAGRGAYARALEELGFRLHFEPSEHVPLALFDVLPEEAPPLPPSVAFAAPWFGDLWVKVTAASDPAELLAVSLLLGAAFLGRLALSNLATRRARDRIPLVIGGWGTRGKSGVERLKAALFEGLGEEVVCKTTGCEAMLLHVPPGRPAVELFLYRPNDRASIWEHAEVLRVGSKLGAPIFLWECMALNPHYVEILQLHWTRDDASTLTNTYPDHEDVHGPTGENVAHVIGTFIPESSLAITTELELTPILVDKARQRDTEMVTVSPEQISRWPADLLARFPYQEHPANIALVATLARELGLDPEEAVILMADHVLPDLGALTTFPGVRHRGRVVQLSNGSSANERTGFLNNWQRCSFDVDPDPGTFLVTVVNNRYDRVARSQVFAEIVVRDAPAHRHVLIGTNLNGLEGYIRAALDAWLVDLDLWGAGPGALATRLAALRRHLRIVGPGTLVRATAPRLGLTDVDALADALDAAVAEAPARPTTLAEARAALGRHRDALVAVAARLGRGAPPPGSLADRPGTDTLFFDDADVARGREDLVDRWLDQAAAAVAFDASARHLALGPEGLPAFFDVVRGVFLAKLDIVAEASSTGDDVIDRIARSCPPGAFVRAMSIQNIKGTGLDFIYRWVHGRVALGYAADLGSTDDSRRRAALANLGAHAEWSIPACREVLAALPPDGDGVAAVRTHVEAELARRERDLGAAARSAGSQQGGSLRKWLKQAFDPADAILRRWTADALFEDLVAGRISHAKAVRELAALTERGRH
jgi:poly-gamma-glutamate synthase PgsB/CapB